MQIKAYKIYILTELYNNSIQISACRQNKGAYVNVKIIFHVIFSTSCQKTFLFRSGKPKQNICVLQCHTSIAFFRKNTSKIVDWSDKKLMQYSNWYWVLVTMKWRTKKILKFFHIMVYTNYTFLKSALKYLPRNNVGFLKKLISKEYS